MDVYGCVSDTFRLCSNVFVSYGRLKFVEFLLVFLAFWNVQTFGTGLINSFKLLCPLDFAFLGSALCRLTFAGAAAEGFRAPELTAI